MVELRAETVAYVDGFPPERREVLTRIRATIVAAAPGAVEAITRIVEARGAEGSARPGKK
ncbi:MAG: DUF1801 domain-containing protein [Acidimicrobiia bacterium]|nr:DUF1801 domain-containing protein [Acidimicrobiia bacterium]